MNTSSIIAAALFTGAVGTIAGILWAPQKGSKARKKVAKKGQQYKDYMQDHYADLGNSGYHTFESLEEEATRLSKKAGAKAEKFKAKVHQKIN